MQTTACPTCGDPLGESTEYCAKCDKAALSGETTLNHTTMTVAQGTLLADIPSTPAIEEEHTTLSPHIADATINTPVSEELTALEPERATDAHMTATAPVSEELANLEPERATDAHMTATAPVSEELAALDSERTAVEPNETDATIRLPQKLTRQKSAARRGARVNAANPPPANTGGSEDALPREPAESETTIQLAKREPRQGFMFFDDVESTIRLPHKAIKRQSWERGLTAPTMKLTLRRKGARDFLEQDLQIPFEETLQEDPEDDEEVVHHGTWQKVVEHKTTQHMAVVLPGEAQGQFNRSRLARLLNSRATRSFFWLSTLILIALLLSGAFGIAASFGRTSQQKAIANPQPSLLVSPTTIALGGIVTMRGSHFTPGGAIALSRDQQIQLVDTNNQNTILADAQGNFSDTFVVDPAWLSGTHILYALDARTQKQATYPLLVTGNNALQGPPHLLLSSSAIDLGSGDETMSSSKMLALSNAGGGVITWQANTNQSWLQVSPQSGSIASGQHASVIISVDRSQLAPGSYQATVDFNSSTGQSVLTVNVAVTALQQRHEAILQLSTASLAFSGTAYGAASGNRTIMLYNPGVLPLTWGASITGSSWLWVSPAGGTIAAGEAQQITVGVTSSHLAAGVYKGAVTISNQGALPIQDSPQSTYVSLTVSPSCALALSAGSLSFTATQGGSAPAGQALNVGVVQGCKTNQSWSVAVATTSGGNWLGVSATSGTTPSTIGISAASGSLAPGTYKGSLTFKSNSGSKTVGITLTVNGVPCTVSGSSALSLQGTAGQANPVTQNATLNASGDCAGTLSWSSSTSAGWLSAGSGSFTSSAAVGIQASLAGLNAGTYNGTVTITVVDSATNQTVGTVNVAVTLTAAQPAPPADPCTLQGPSTGTLGFNAQEGTNPATPSASFTLSVTGTCSDAITITPAVDSAGSGWLTVSAPVTISSGSTATFTVTVTSTGLKKGTYSSVITLSASDGITGSPRQVTVTVTIS